MINSQENERINLLYWFYQQEIEKPGTLQDLNLIVLAEQMDINKVILNLNYLNEKKYISGGLFNSHFIENARYLGRITAEGIDYIKNYSQTRESFQTQRLPLPHELIDVPIKNLGIIPPSYLFDNVIKQIGLITPSEFVDQISNKIKEGEITSNNEFLQIIDCMIKELTHYIENKKGYLLLWEKDEPVLESKIQIYIDNILQIMCKYYDIDLNRETHTGRGLIDFKFSKGQLFKVLLEIKKAESPSLIRGLKNQLITYLKAESITAVGSCFRIHRNRQ